MIDLNAIETALTKICEEYERSAPTVYDWANDLYVRINDRPEDVRLPEILLVRRLYAGGGFNPPSEAANQVFKLMNRLGQDTKGHFGF